MAATNEPAKLLLPYLQRADELQTYEPLVACYCRLYAMERGLKIPQNERTNTTNSLLVSLINQLEKDRSSLKLSPDHHLHVEGFALNVFAKADKQDRAGRADMNTAKTFYAASIFFEVLNHFGELGSDLEQKQKYAAWKAADIRKALKEGRKPVSGTPDGDSSLSTPSAPSNCNDVERQNAGKSINPSQESDPPTQFHDFLKRKTSSHIQPSSPPPFSNGDYSSRTADYPSHNYQSSYPSSKAENLKPPQPNRTQSCPQEPHQPHHFQQNHSCNDIPESYSYPNFQSYPSFSDSSLSSIPSHSPSYNQSSDASYSHQPRSSSSVTNHSLALRYNSSSRNGGNDSARAQTYHYDSNYEPPPEKIAEAQKAARFAVGALAFDEVPVAVEHLIKALEFLTNRSAGL